jgi:hypothetical protein
MAETGWPLIPREVLPAPIPAARSAPRRPLPLAGDPPADPGRQLSIFGAETTEPSPADLAGLLAGPGHLGRMGGTARVSVRVDAAWRVHVLVKELVRRGLVVSWLPVEKELETEQINPFDGTAHQLPNAGTTSDQHTDPTPAPEYDDEPASAVIGRGGAPTPGPEVEVISDKSHQNPAKADNDVFLDEDPESDTNARADHVIGDGDAPADRGADAAGVPVRGGVAFFEVRTAYSSRLNGLARSWPAAAHELFLSGPRLRLWVAAAGRPMADGYALGLGPGEDPAIIDAALVRAGLAGTVSDDGRYYLILGRKRLKRLAELVGERPGEAPAAFWPSGVAA